MQPTLDSAAMSVLDPFSDEVLHDPYPVWRQLRDLGPVVRLEHRDTWVLARYEQVRSALADPARFASAMTTGGRNATVVDAVIGGDRAELGGLRSVLSSGLTPGALGRLRAGIAARADQLVADVVVRGTFDAVTDLAMVLSVSVVADLVGLPESSHEPLVTFADALFTSCGSNTDQSRAALPVVHRVSDYLAAEMVPGKLRPGGWGDLVYQAAEQGLIEMDGVLPLLVSYLGPSLHTTISSIGNLLLLLAENPHEYQRMRAYPQLIGPAYEEALRLESPIQGIFRRSSTEIDLDGVAIPAGANILLSLASANRDERYWQDPDQFQVQRNPIEHLSFGHGPAHCTDQHLPRLQAHALLAALIRNVPTIDLAGPPQRRPHNNIRGLTSLPLTTSGRLTTPPRPQPRTRHSV